MSNNNKKDIKVAIIDDNKLVRESMNFMLSHWGYSVILEACNGKDLFDQLKEDNLPDICIVDINMPEMNGHETINILKKTWPNIKTIIFSMEIRKASTLPNADAVLSKGTEVTEIKYVLERLVPPQTSQLEEITINNLPYEPHN